MKKLLQKKPLCAALLLILYISIALLGALAMVSYPVYCKQKSFLLPTAQTIAREFTAGSSATLDYMTGSDARILILDQDGVCLRHVAPNHAQPDADPGRLHLRDLPGVLSGRSVFRPVVYYNAARSRIDITVVTGVPIRCAGRVTGAVFLEKTLKNLPDALFGFLLYFTIFYWLCAGLLLLYLHKVDALNRLQRSYVANVTHALKTPVTSIKALSETLCADVEPDPDKQKAYCGMILREANRQDRMVRDILDLSRLQSHGTDLSRQSFYAPTVFQSVLEKYGALADCMGITLYVSDALGSMPPLYSNAASIRQILEILLDNALKFAPEDGEIRLEISCTKKRATFCVRDNGPGIPADALPHVFERFYKYSHRFNESGSGLGLAIAKELTAGLREKLWVESKPGCGAAFFFTVRLK